MTATVISMSNESISDHTVNDASTIPITVNDQTTVLSIGDIIEEKGLCLIIYCFIKSWQ